VPYVPRTISSNDDWSAGEKRPLDADQPERLQKMIAIYERYAEEKGIVPVADDWNPFKSL
jgi:hypothetical protein